MDSGSSLSLGGSRHTTWTIKPKESRYEVGTLGFGNFKTFGNWTLDMSASKTFNISESKSVQIRIDSTNVLNHPTPSNPSFSANTFGVSDDKNGERSLQGQLRFMF